MILVTGSEGLIGRHVVLRLEAAGHDVRRFDIRRSVVEDTRSTVALIDALKGVTGVVHLAAISRVQRAEADPQACDATNVAALQDLLALCLGRPRRPWVVFVSSREVYGAQAVLPVPEEACLDPINVYARSKVAGEALIKLASAAGLMTNICRLSNVYGCPLDHPDRVVVAFAAVAARGGVMRMDGPDCQFDFTAVDDVADGLSRLIEASVAGEQLPPVHLVTGQGTTLRELAGLAAGLANQPVQIIQAAARSYDVSRFVGDPTRARALLGWEASTDVSTGLSNLVSAFRAQGAAPPNGLPRQ